MLRTLGTMRCDCEVLKSFSDHFVGKQIYRGKRSEVMNWQSWEGRSTGSENVQVVDLRPGRGNVKHSDAAITRKPLWNKEMCN